MKKIILLVLVALMMVGCKEHRVTHKYEVLLPTKDTMYVEAWHYEFFSERTVVFYDTRWMDILTVYDPIYIREIK